MKQKRPGFSLGTIFTLCLTVAVTVGCVFMLGKMRGGNSNAQMDAQRVIGAMGSVMRQPTLNPEAQATVNTVKVTLAPAVAVIQNTPLPTAAPQVKPQGEQSYSFSLTVGGMLAFQSDISSSVYDKTEKTLDYRPVVSTLSGKIYGDLNMVSFPQVINTADKKWGDYMVPQEAADAVRACGFDDAVLGNEHILDQGAAGALDTVDTLMQRSIICEGVSVNGTPQNRVLQLNGAGLAILSYTDVLTQKSKNTLSQSPDLLRMYAPETVRKDIQTARGQGAQCVIVCMYWGKTDTAAPTNAMRQTAQQLSEMGADVILGFRPTRVLPMEFISLVDDNGKARDVFVAYSLGSLLTESRDKYDICGALLHLNVRCDAQGRVRFDSVEYTPTYIWRQQIGGQWQYRLLCSADNPPEEMSEQQRDVMKRALERVQDTLKDSPVTQRK